MGRLALEGVKKSFGGVSWFEVREAVKRGWEERRESESRQVHA